MAANDRHPWRDNGRPAPDPRALVKAIPRSVYDSCPDSCESCIYKTALPLAAAKYPGLTKLVEALEALR